MNGDGESVETRNVYGESAEHGTSLHEGESREGAATGRERRVRRNPTHEADGVDRALAAQGKRISASEAAVAASAVVDEFQALFPDVTEHRLVKAALPLAPLVLLRPSQRGLRDPRILAGAAGLAIAISAELTNQRRQVEWVQITGSTTAPLKTGSEFKLSAEARDGSGRPIAGQMPKWETSDAKVLEVDESGVVSAKKPGTARIKAVISPDGGAPVSDFAVVTVE